MEFRICICCIKLKENMQLYNELLKKEKTTIQVLIAIIYGNINVSNRAVDFSSARKLVKFWHRSPRIAVSERLHKMSV